MLSLPSLARLLPCVKCRCCLEIRIQDNHAGISYSQEAFVFSFLSRHVCPKCCRGHVLVAYSKFKFNWTCYCTGYPWTSILNLNPIFLGGEKPTWGRHRSFCPTFSCTVGICICGNPSLSMANTDSLIFVLETHLSKGP